MIEMKLLRRTKVTREHQKSSDETDEMMRIVDCKDEEMDTEMNKVILKDERNEIC